MPKLTYKQKLKALNQVKAAYQVNTAAVVIKACLSNTRTAETDETLSKLAPGSNMLDFFATWLYHNGQRTININKH